MTEMEIKVPENFPDEDDEEWEDTEGDDVQTEHDNDPEPRSASHKTSPTFISRLASLFSTGDSRETRLKVVVHNQAYKISNVWQMFNQLEERDQFVKEHSGEKVIW